MPIKLINDPLKFAGEPTPKAVVQEMVTKYKENLKDYGDKEIKRMFPARSNQSQGSCIWVSVSELIQLITDNGANGIRVYFGQHTKGSSAKKPDFEGLITTIFVATRDNVNPASPTYDNSEDLLNESDDETKANSVTIAGPFLGQADDRVPICNPRCPPPGSKMMKIDI